MPRRPHYDDDKHNYLDLTDKVFDKLTVIERVFRDSNWVWRCKCECGETCFLSSAILLRIPKTPRSCERCKEVKLPSKYPDLYLMYKNIKKYTLDVNKADKKIRGTPGLTICEEWTLPDGQGFKNFFAWAKEHDWNEHDKFGINRIDKKKGYTPDNCKLINKGLNYE